MDSPKSADKVKYYSFHDVTTDATTYFGMPLHAELMDKSGK